MERMEVDPYAYALTGWLFQNKATPTFQIQSGLSCKHLRASINDEMISSYELLYAFYVVCIRKGSGKRKVKDCICRTCKEANDQKSSSDRKPIPVHACLSCVYFGCFNGKCHIKEHSKQEKHPFAMDTNCGQVYCFHCGDYKYDNTFMKIAEKLSAIARHRNSAMKSEVKPIIGKLVVWEPSHELIPILKHQRKDIVYNSETGIRRLLNLGNFTCYLNVTIHCLFHAPVFRDYLLSLKHACNSDKIKARDFKGDKKVLCLICQMTNAIQESFSGKMKPLILAKVVTGFFYRCKHYATKDFQDAHICFEDLLVNFHEDVIGKVEPRDNSCSLVTSWPCKCIIHEIFGFYIQTEKICHNCKYLSVGGNFASSICLNKLESPKSNNETVNVTLTEGLQSTWNEVVDGAKCSECKETAGYTLKSKPITLPCILNICSNQYNILSGKSTFLEFEETLDLSPYILPFWKTKRDSIPEHAYYLFAFVEFDRGHYRCYIRKAKDKWFKCDDTETAPISVKEVLKINVRVLFYHKMHM